MTRKILAALMLLGVLSLLGAVSGCNTIAGAGTDIEKGGREIRDEAKDVQKKM
jgi:entericidin B